MKTLLEWTLAGLMALGGCTPAQRTERRDAGAGTAQEQVIGAWRLAWLDQPGPDGSITRITDAKGSLIYTPDGVVSVQVMFAQGQAPPSNAPVQYAQGGYEASFGRYVVNPAASTVTHHYEGSLVRSLLGQDLPRLYEFSEGRLIIRSTRPDEHWSVEWEAPDQRLPVRPGRDVFQSKVLLGDPPREYLVRVFVDVDRQPAEIVTVYRTSRIAKYMGS